MFLARMKLPPERREIDAFEFRLEWLEFRAALCQQRMEPGAIAACLMMERRRHLDEAVKEGLAIAGCAEPNGLECFVGLKVALRVEEADALENSLLHHDFNFRTK